jgi:signal transduction histidine kinase
VTSRIVGAVLALVVGMLALLVVPLGIASARHERDIFRASTSASAHAIASVAEERLSDSEPDPALKRYLDGTASAEDGIAVVARDGRLVATSGDIDNGPLRLVARTAHGTEVHRWYDDDGRPRLAVAVPVLSGHGGVVGTVIFTRSAAHVNDNIARLWWRLAAAGVVALLIASLLAVSLSRWVARPLGELEHAADLLGDGALDTLAPDAVGPPELRRLAKSFNRMARRLEALIQDHTTSTAEVAHQLRTPLAALRLRIELLAAGEQHDDADAALAEVARLSRLVDGLLALARAESADARPLAVDVAAVVASRVSYWEPLAAELGITIELGESAVGGVAVLGPGHLEQILDNLIDNALSAVSRGGRVTLKSRHRAHEIVVEVADDGPGIPPGERAAALARFTTTDGTGLGLAVVHRLVTADGGTVELADSELGGLAVRIAWPARQPRVRPARS